MVTRQRQLGENNSKGHSCGFCSKEWQADLGLAC
jgi:hypothetical protein